MNKIDFIAYTEGICFTKGWSADDIRAELDSEYGICCVEDGIGYALGRISFDEAELHRIAVLPEKRRAHCGERLLRSFILQCTQRGAKKIFLEVRSKNIPAVHLYEKCGFEKLCVRKGYYGDDDAVVYLFTKSRDRNADFCG